jgi:hypothetical protein
MRIGVSAPTKKLYHLRHHGRNKKTARPHFGQVIGA